MINDEQQKEYDFRIRLSETDAERICEKAGSVGMTPSELIENFIGDLVDGINSNGSDERMYADEWFKRCRFSNESEESFLSWLVTYYGVYELHYIADIYSDIINFNREQYILQNGDDEIANVEEELKEYKSEIMEKFSEYCKFNPHAETFEKEMKSVLKWHKELSEMTKSH